MTYKWILICCLCFCLLCDLDPSENTEFKFYCPTCEEDVTWESYGDFHLLKSGYDETPSRLISKCGWSVYEGHKGGTGDTFEVYHCDYGVRFVWAWNKFAKFILRERWKGQTKEGIRMGDTPNEFLSKCSDFRRNYYGSYIMEYGDVEVTADFKRTEQDTVYRLYRLEFSAWDAAHPGGISCSPF